LVISPYLAKTNHNYLIAYTPSGPGEDTIAATLGERNVTVIAKSISLPMTITSSINPGLVTPGQKVVFKVNADITGNVGTANINSMEIKLNYDPTDLRYSGTVRSFEWLGLDSKSIW